MKRVVVVGHADADGHVIAEQVRRNLASVPTFSVEIVVDPERTKDHNVWFELASFPEIERADYVFFVDMMFAPASFVGEASALTRFASERPAKRFFLIDHHPVPLRRLSVATNLRTLYKEDVLDCAFGVRSDMMIIAALCETQRTRARTLKTKKQVEIAKGVKRAAAIGGPLAGEKLMALLRWDRWDDLAELGRDDPKFHRLPRGRRPKGSKISKVHQSLIDTASQLGVAPAPGPKKGDQMSYDVESRADYKPALEKTGPKDLEAIVTVLEVAALYLTPKSGAQFTMDELLNQANEIAGEGFVIEPGDIQNVLGKTGFLKKLTGKKFVLKY